MPLSQEYYLSKIAKLLGGVDGAGARALESISRAIENAAPPKLSFLVLSTAAAADPIVWFEGPLGQNVYVDWSDGAIDTLAMLGLDPTGNWLYAVEGTHIYTDGQSVHRITITGDDLNALDLVALFLPQADSGPLNIAPLLFGGCLQFYCGTVGWNALPLQLSGLIALQQLWVNNNDLTLLPSLSGLTALQQLGVYGNRLATLPSLTGLTALQVVLCFSDQLAALPDLSGLTALTTLDAHDNLLTEAAVNQALADLIVLQTATPAVRTIDLSGTGNHAPTGQGATDKATLIGAGWTVATN